MFNDTINFKEISIFTDQNVKGFFIVGKKIFIFLRVVHKANFEQVFILNPIDHLCVKNNITDEDKVFKTGI